MGVFRFVTNGFIKPCVDVKSWFGWSSFSTTTGSLVRMLKPIFTFHRKKYEHDESFQHAMDRLGISKAEIKRKSTFLHYHSIVYITLLSLCLIYSIYLVAHAHIFSMFVTLLIGVLFVVKTIEARLWIFQIKHERLGCTIKEWWHGEIKEKE